LIKDLHRGTHLIFNKRERQFRGGLPLRLKRLEVLLRKDIDIKDLGKTTNITKSEINFAFANS
jgi:hypothetical protein